MVRFSERIPGDLTPTALARARERAPNVPFDLTVSNPTLCGLSYPPGLLSSLADERGLIHDPDPAGLPAARAAVAADHSRRGIEIDPRRVILTTSTSEAYSLLFKLLCNPGERVAIPFPSYPLLQHLVTLEGLEPAPYRLAAHDAWQPDVAQLSRAGAQAIVVVHPNNPTGSYLAPETADRLREACRRSETALIVDEVFFDFPLEARPLDVSSFAASDRALSFTLGGLSKLAGLPQLKLGWIVVGGEPAEADHAVERLSFIADQYLSVAAPVQLALESLLRHGTTVHDAILERCRRNLEALARAVASTPSTGLTLLRPAAGWSAILRYPAILDEQRLALDLLEQDGVAVQPGYLFDFETDGHLVLSLLAEPSVFDEGTARLMRRLASAES